MRLNNWIYKQIKGYILGLDEQFCERFRIYIESDEEDLNKRILSAAHFYATKWEFDIIERANPNGYEISEIKSRLQSIQEKYYDLAGIKDISLYPKYKNFIDMCGLLRFQLRWSHIHMVPRISVLGHMLIVAILSYLLSLETSACYKRKYNNFFTGLFHDLPEVLTRDIIDPVKRSIKGLDKLIKKYEKEEMERIYQLIPEDWHKEMKMFMEDEFENIIEVDGKIVRKGSHEIECDFNKDEYNPRDGKIIEISDHLAAFIEAYLATNNGIKNKDLEEAIQSIRKRYKDAEYSGINIGMIYADF
jgi:putative hydrolase of HD superfamily